MANRRPFQPHDLRPDERHMESGDEPTRAVRKTRQWASRSNAHNRNVMKSWRRQLTMVADAKHRAHNRRSAQNAGFASQLCHAKAAHRAWKKSNGGERRGMGKQRGRRPSKSFPTKKASPQSPQNITNTFAEVKKESTQALDGLPQRLELLAIRVGGKTRLAELIGVHQAGMARYWRRDKPQLPRADILVRLALVTACDCTWLLTGIGEPFPPTNPQSPAGRDQLDLVREHLSQTLHELGHTIRALSPLLAPTERAELDAAIARVSADPDVSAAEAKR